MVARSETRQGGLFYENIRLDNEISGMAKELEGLVAEARALHKYLYQNDIILTDTTYLLAPSRERAKDIGKKSSAVKRAVERGFYKAAVREANELIAGASSFQYLRMVDETEGQPDYFPSLIRARKAALSELKLARERLGAVIGVFSAAMDAIVAEDLITLTSGYGSDTPSYPAFGRPSDKRRISEGFGKLAPAWENRAGFAKAMLVEFEEQQPQVKELLDMMKGGQNADRDAEDIAWLDEEGGGMDPAAVRKAIADAEAAVASLKKAHERLPGLLEGKVYKRDFAMSKPAIGGRNEARIKAVCINGLDLSGEARAFGRLNAAMAHMQRLSEIYEEAHR